MELVAVQSVHTIKNEWWAAPKEFFLNERFIPDGHLNVEIPGMEEIMDHTYLALDSSDGVSYLEAAGVEIITNPIWYYHDLTQHRKREREYRVWKSNLVSDPEIKGGWSCLAYTYKKL